MPHRTIYQKAKTTDFQLTQISITRASRSTMSNSIRFLDFLDRSHGLQAAYPSSWRCDVVPSFIVSKHSMNCMAAWSALHLMKCHLSTHKLAVIYMATARAIDLFPRTRYGCLRFQKKMVARRPHFLTLMTRTTREFARHGHMASAIRL